jgi:aminoglycoside/choline kinase family phosphotransferase
MHARQNELNEWLEQLFHKPFSIKPLAGDASFRRYFRLDDGETSYVIMDAPPEKENTAPFIKVAHLLKTMHVHAPTIHAIEENKGFLLLEDLGDELLLKHLSLNNADSLYKAAMDPLLRMQQYPINQPLPLFDKNYMLQELSLFHDWFLNRYLGLSLTQDKETLLKETFTWLIDHISKQPQVFIHRDYHSRNLLLIRQEPALEIGVIDFQDAMKGPFAYDLVSLLKDCYIQWPREQVLQWVTYFYHQNSKHHGWSLAEFIEAFDLCGLQRHLKVLGIFCRLYLRDNKSNYLNDLPLVFRYVTACTESYKELQSFHHFMQNEVYLPFLNKSSQAVI